MYAPRNPDIDLLRPLACHHMNLSVPASHAAHNTSSPACAWLFVAHSDTLSSPLVPLVASQSVAPQSVRPAPSVAAAVGRLLQLLHTLARALQPRCSRYCHSLYHRSRYTDASATDARATNSRPGHRRLTPLLAARSTVARSAFACCTLARTAIRATTARTTAAGSDVNRPVQ